MIVLERAFNSWQPQTLEDARALEGIERVQVVPEADKVATRRQQNAMHQYCRQIADDLNESGQDQRAVLDVEVEIPWTMEAVKHQLWAVIQKLMTGQDSTTEMSTVDPSEIHRVLDAHLAKTRGVSRPWPSKDPPIMGD